MTPYEGYPTWIGIMNHVAIHGDPNLAEWMREVARAYIRQVIKQVVWEDAVDPL